MDMKKLEKQVNNFKNASLKGIEIERQKLCKQMRNQIVWKQVEDELKGCYRRRINSKAFAIPILIAFSL